jgi:serine/threonine-protein kinase HipA
LGLDVLEPGFVEFPVEDAAALPGVITKFSAVLEGRRYVVKRHGAAGEYILKLPTTRHPDLVANEAMGYRLCRAMGLDCANARIISRDEADVPEVVPFEPILAVERFDRGAGGKRIHIEEFAQALQYEPQHKYGKSLRYDYANMLRVLEHLSGKPAHDVPEFIRRFIVFVLMGNTDAHLKNWALRYPDGVTPELAPLYDPVCVAAYFDEVPATDYGINRVIDKTVRAFTWNDLESLLREAGLLRKGRLMNIARDTVRQAQSDWPALLAEAPLNIQKSVTERLNGGVMLAK